MRPSLIQVSWTFAFTNFSRCKTWIHTQKRKHRKKTLRIIENVGQIGACTNLRDIFWRAFKLVTAWERILGWIINSYRGIGMLQFYSYLNVLVFHLRNLWSVFLYILTHNLYGLKQAENIKKIIYINFNLLRITAVIHFFCFINCLLLRYIWARHPS